MTEDKKIYPWWKPLMGESEKKLLCQVIDSGFPNDGAITEQFENYLKEFLEVKHAIAVTSCTAGLYLSLMACNIGPGDEVLVPDITFIATANAVSMTGAKPILVDVDRTNFCIDLNSARKAITKNTKAIIPVHVSGRPANLAGLAILAEEHKLIIIEDAAEALGSKFDHKFLGSIGLTGCFSFSPAKTITTGQGGLIITNSDAINARLRELKDQGRPKRGTGGNDLHVSIGFNFKFTDLQASMGMAQTETLSQRIKTLQKHYQIYQECLANNTHIFLPEFDITNGACPQWIDLYVNPEEDNLDNSSVKIENSNSRDSLYDYLKERKADCRKFWFPLHTQTPYLRGNEEFKNSMAVSNNSMWLPSSLDLSETDIKTVAEFINVWSKSSKKIVVSVS